MPELSRFYGIVIRMYANDHAPPHFHAYYNDFQILVDIHNFSILMGNFPPKAMGLVMEWATMHQRELVENWALASNKKHTFRIEPLQ
ncbi:MAG TPA: DUF4160 domain-containing protein [Spirochaetota bacterium]|nr:DUF4160 domain-containing protein [Spirochaetota bacterium]